MTFKTRLIVMLFEVFNLAVNAQDNAIEILINRYLPDQELEANTESFLEEIQLLIDNPLNPNTAKREDFERLFFLNDELIDAMIGYREHYGEFMTIYELIYVDGMTSELVELILPFIVLRSAISEDNSILNSIVKSEKKVLTRYSRKLARFNSQNITADKNEYLGHPDHVFGKISIHDPARLKLGFSYEKDPGEKLSWDLSKKQFGFDHYSGHLMITSKNIFKKILFGDFRLLFGQGLIQGSGFSLGKGMDPVASVRKKGQTIRPHTGSAEFGYLRGIAFELDLDPVRITTYSSYNKLDAIIQWEDTATNNPFVKSIVETGLHRETNEINRKNQQSRLILGISSEFRNRKRNFSAGITMQFSQFEYPLITDRRIYNQFDFRGRNNSLGGAYIQFRHKSVLFFGEGAISCSKATAHVSGFIGNISDYIETTVLIRNYGKAYHAFEANGFGESDNTRNEKGIYWGNRIKPLSNISIDIYYDHFSFPWIKYRSYAPSEGYDSQFRLNYRISRFSNIYFQFRQKEKEHNILNSGGTYGLEKLKKKSFRINISYKPESGIRTNSRIQWSNSQWMDSTTNGLCIVQDIGWYGKRIKLISRFAIFDTGNYENRQYVYENDVLYYYAIPAYTGEGIRNYVVLHYKMNRHINASIKMARTYYNDQKFHDSLLRSYSAWEIRSQIQFTL